LSPAEIATLVVQIIVAIGGSAGIVSLAMVSSQKKKLVSESGKTDAEADAAFSEAYHRRASTQVTLLEPYERIQTRMQAEIDEYADKVDRLEEYVELLIEVLRNAGLPVPPKPPKR
jgi:UTP-glucose-1-phosphate uridylyltransferase